MKSYLLFAVLLIGCGSESPMSENVPANTGGAASIQAVAESTGGDAPLLATGGSSAAAQATGGAFALATGGRASTGGSVAGTGGFVGTGGVTGCIPKTCRELGPLMSGLSATMQYLTIGNGCADSMNCYCQMVQATGGYVGYCL